MTVIFVPAGGPRPALTCRGHAVGIDVEGDPRTRCSAARRRRDASRLNTCPALLLPAAKGAPPWKTLIVTAGLAVVGGREHLAELGRDGGVF